MQQLGEWEEGNLTAALDKNLLSRFTADADAADISDDDVAMMLMLMLLMMLLLMLILLMLLSSSTRSYTRRSVPLSPGRSFFVSMLNACRNYGETLHSVAKAPFEEVTLPKVVYGTFIFASLLVYSLSSEILTFLFLDLTNSPP